MKSRFSQILIRNTGAHTQHTKAPITNISHLHAARTFFAPMDPILPNLALPGSEKDSEDILALDTASRVLLETVLRVLLECSSSGGMEAEL